MTTRHLTSPVSWLIAAVFALLSGVAFLITLNAFLDRSAEALTQPPLQPINVNQLLIRPFLSQLAIAALLVLPLVTARAKRQAAAAMFADTLTMYVAMLLPSLVLVVLLFGFGTPEWGPIATGYIGLLLIGAAFISVGLAITSVASSPWAAAAATFALSLMLAAATWLARAGTPGARAIFRHVSVGEPIDDFAKGVLDTGHIVACLTIIALGVFVTKHTLDAQRPGS
jgi:ABC-2 type transport system permease protein